MKLPCPASTSGAGVAAPGIAQVQTATAVHDCFSQPPVLELTSALATIGLPQLPMPDERNSMHAIASSAATVAIAISDEPATWLVFAERALSTNAIVLSKSA